ncbi:peptidase M28 [Paraflavitalea soli]|uniref:Peptidase M28 n=1 Tax=Paraflavitalea soli TaxID=2315862 RepID=A0A3B7MRV0_9BACT|nr:M28 family peptidase [Paraflavitalea soli]AXY76093.1 peptidase M28 [Paraflavitalea soli]
MRITNKPATALQLLVLILLCSGSIAQQPSSREKKYFNLLRSRFVADNAYKTVAFVEQRWRIAGNAGFNESIFYVEKILQQAGFVKETSGEADAALTYRIEKRPMQRPTWEPVNAQLYIVGDDKPLLNFTTNRNMLAMYSGSTPAAGVTAELIDIGKANDKDLEAKDLTGKIIMADGGIGSAYAKAVKKGALGALSYALPGYTQPQKHVNSIQFQGIRYEADSTLRKWGILLSYAAREKLKAALAKGPVQVRVVTQAKIYPSEELTIVANVRGTVKPAERFVFSAHVQEPGANDNATGVGTLAEMARVTALLVKAGKIAPERTITFLWGDEIISTNRYIKDDSIRAQGIKWGLSLDMVGEDVKKTGGSFLIEKMPDPSAIWTRGNDKHSEWGGSALKESDMFPHYFNDLLLNRCLQESKATGWVVNTNPFEGGSDHTPFLNAKIPGLLMWHFTDVFYHTDGDRLDMVSAEEMKHVGLSALVTAYLLTQADQKTTVALIKDITANALQRLQTECVLSKEVIQKGGDAAAEKHILEVWRDWYLAALGKTTDIAVKGAGKKITSAIAKAQKQVTDQAAKCIAGW